MGLRVAGSVANRRNPGGRDADGVRAAASAAREARGWSLAQLAARIPADKGQLSRVERGQRTPGDGLVRRADLVPPRQQRHPNHRRRHHRRRLPRRRRTGNLVLTPRRTTASRYGKKVNAHRKAVRTPSRVPVQGSCLLVATHRQPPRQPRARPTQRVRSRRAQRVTARKRHKKCRARCHHARDTQALPACRGGLVQREEEDQRRVTW